jgi:colanic acid biosynthesis glycosyl transferase WcaI
MVVNVRRRRKVGVLPTPTGWFYRLLEGHQSRNSDAVVAISDDFVPLAASWSGSKGKVTGIETWAAVDDFPLLTKVSAWSTRHECESSVNFVYSGTLGLKHKPELLAELAPQLAGYFGGCRSERCGPGSSHPRPKRPWASGAEATTRATRGRTAQVLAASDVLIAIIDSEAGSFAVPSKVQSYLCAGRPVLLAAP